MGGGDFFQRATVGVRGRRDFVAMIVLGGVRLFFTAFLRNVHFFRNHIDFDAGSNRTAFGAFVGIAAGLLAPQYPVFPTVGTYFVLTAFVIVVLGGLGSLYGAVAGSMIIGIVDTLAGYYIAPDLKEVVYFGIFLLILVLRPTGLFGVGTE